MQEALRCIKQQPEGAEHARLQGVDHERGGHHHGLHLLLHWPGIVHWHGDR